MSIRADESAPDLPRMFVAVGVSVRETSKLNGSKMLECVAAQCIDGYQLWFRFWLPKDAPTTKKAAREARRYIAKMRRATKPDDVVQALKELRAYTLSGTVVGRDRNEALDGVRTLGGVNEPTIVLSHVTLEPLEEPDPMFRGF